MVRVVEVPGVSMELCGGTHIKATGQAGSFYILSEAGVAAGTRRIEATTGVNAVKHVREMRGELDETLKPIKHYYLGDQDAIAAAMNAVANQGKAKA